MNAERNGHMMAAVLYGREDLKIERIAIPRVGSNDLLVRVKVALTCGTDFKVWRQGYHARMISPPALFGHEMAGIVEEAGEAVRDRFQPGMRVVAANSAPCNGCFFCLKDRANLCEDLLFNNGAYAEYALIPGRILRENVMEIPPHLSYVDAALVEPLACVLRGIEETGISPGDTAVVIGCGPIGLKFMRVLSGRGVRVIAVGKRASQMKAAEGVGATAAIDCSKTENAVAAVRQLTHGKFGADAVIEAVGTPTTWQWAMQMVRCGGTVNLFGGCPRGTKVEFESSALHYSEITIKSSFHHTPRFIREALAAISRGEISARDFVTGEIRLSELPDLFQHMKNKNGQLKVAVMP
ncbi:MAG TPA: alcohol dehydrogenase catalytic domain-containing protein [Terriglobia bacterium]|nr:alcohol dehydrogenase catalytic domain-containing protein [Terriglobia bacterium]